MLSLLTLALALGSPDSTECTLAVEVLELGEPAPEGWTKLKVFPLLDRTGSSCPKWEESIMAQVPAGLCTDDLVEGDIALFHYIRTNSLTSRGSSSYVRWTFLGESSRESFRSECITRARVEVIHPNLFATFVGIEPINTLYCPVPGARTQGTLELASGVSAEDLLVGSVIEIKRQPSKVRYTVTRVAD